MIFKKKCRLLVLFELCQLTKTPEAFLLATMSASGKNPSSPKLSDKAYIVGPCSIKGCKGHGKARPEVIKFWEANGLLEDRQANTLCKEHLRMRGIRSRDQYKADEGEILAAMRELQRTANATHHTAKANQRTVRQIARGQRRQERMLEGLYDLAKQLTISSSGGKPLPLDGKH